jgi:hypothetical protein
MSIEHKINEINRNLNLQMQAKGCRFVTREPYQHFIGADGAYAPYPPGYIRGIGSTCMSVQGHNGWHQRTFQTIARAQEWALETAREVLAQQPVTTEPS